MTQRGVVYTIAPSPRDESVIWAGTDDGLTHITRDAGKSWQNVLTRLRGQLTQMFDIVEQADAAPTSQVQAAWKTLSASVEAAVPR